MNLGDLFDRHGSDKAHNGHAHHYHDDYERLVPRDTKVLVELGLGSHIGFDGSFGSPRAWLEWLDGGQYIGVDIVEPPATSQSIRGSASTCCFRRSSPAGSTSSRISTSTARR